MDQRLLVDMFVKHGVLAQEETIYYILGKKNPRDYVQRLFNAKPQFPLVLALKDLLEIEERILKKEQGAVLEKDITKAVEAVVGKMEDAPGPAGEPAPRPSLAPGEKTGPVVPLRALEPSMEAKEVRAAPAAQKEPVRTKGRKADGGFDIKISLGKKYKPLAAEFEPQVEILEDITGNSTCVGELSDFKTYFLDRFDTLKKMIRNNRSEMGGAVPISRAKVSGGEVRVIGMVQEVSTSKKGHKLFTIEDPDDTMLCMINVTNEQLIKLDIIHDEVIGIVGKYDKRRDMLFVDSVVWPEVPRFRESQRADVPLSAAFISDIHIGSKTFLTRSWNKFIDWLNGRSDSKMELSVASGVKYLVMVGDLVDGIGIYPDQYEDLDIKDIFEQYEALSHELDRIPDHIEVIVMPGNHDAVRPAEPQPALPKMISETFDRKLTLCGNPCYMKLSGVEVLAYHGRSIDDFVPAFEHVTNETPLEAMKEMLNRRHLLPMYGQKTPIAPEHKDHMVIRKVPDIFVTGHVHSFGARLYRDVIMLNSSTWQSQTSYQKMLNFVPNPAKVPVINLQSRKPYQLDFMGA